MMSHFPFKPFEYGVDITVHSTTKWIGWQVFVMGRLWPNDRCWISQHRKTPEKRGVVRKTVILMSIASLTEIPATQAKVDEVVNESAAMMVRLLYFFKLRMSFPIYTIAQTKKWL